MVSDVNSSHCLGGQGPHSLVELGEEPIRCGQGEDRPVVVGVAVHVEQTRASGVGQSGQGGLAAALADIHHAFEHRKE
jgi:hypothetical protein